MDRKRSSEGETGRILQEFLDIAINSIVFLKGVYPCGAFERQRYANLVVHKATHPGLRDYIRSAVGRLIPFVEKGSVDRVAVIFYSKEGDPLERFIFKLQLNQSQGLNVEESDLESSLRSFLLKLSASNTLTKALLPDCRWEIAAYFSELPQVSTSKDAEFWILAHTKPLQQPPLITPIKSMSSEPLFLQLYLEHPNFSESESRSEKLK